MTSPWASAAVRFPPQPVRRQGRDRDCSPTPAGPIPWPTASISATTPATAEHIISAATPVCPPTSVRRLCRHRGSCQSGGTNAAATVLYVGYSSPGTEPTRSAAAARCPCRTFAVRGLFRHRNLHQSGGSNTTVPSISAITPAPAEPTTSAARPRWPRIPNMSAIPARDLQPVGRNQY